MYKLVLIFYDGKLPPDFANRWSQSFVPLAEQLPGLRRVTVSHVEGGPSGASSIRLIHELYFDDREAITAAMASTQGVAAGQALVKLVGSVPGTVEMAFADHMEEVQTDD
jgi:uncharacterized protein (TIGR02118 family)